VPSLNLKPNPRGGTEKKITSSSYKKFAEATQKNKSNGLLNPKPLGLRRMLFVVFQKDGREGLAGIQHRLTVYQIRTPNQLFLSLTIGRKKRYMTLIVYSALVVFLKTSMEKAGYDVRNVSDGRKHFVLVLRKILFVRLVRSKQAYFFVHSLYPLHL
jgi:hypothetical protein